MPYIVFLLQILVVLLITFLIWNLAFWPLKWSQSGPQLNFFLIIAFNFYAFFFGLNLLFNKYVFLINANELAKEYKNIGQIPSFCLNPLFILIGITRVSIICFAALASFLNNIGLISFNPELGQDNLIPLINFFTWHLADFIPQFKIPETFGWEQQLSYANNLIAILLISFKIIITRIIIERIVFWNKWRKKAFQPIKINKIQKYPPQWRKNGYQNKQ